MLKRSIRWISTAALGAALVAVAPATASAQEGSLVLGFMRTNLTFAGAGAMPTTSGSGFLVGGAISTSTKRPVSFEVDGLVVSKGANAATGLTIQLYYLECPVLARTDLEITKSARFHAYAGPQFGVLVHTGGTSSSLTGDSGANVSHADLSVVAGGGIDWRGTLVDLRYTRSLNHITSPVLFGPGVTAQSHTVSLVFVFRLK